MIVKKICLKDSGKRGKWENILPKLSLVKTRKLKANREDQNLSLFFSPNLQWNDNSPSEGSSCHSAQTFRFRWKARCPNRTARPLSEQASTGRQMTACVAFFTALEKQTDFLKCSRQLFCGVRKYLFLAESSATSRWPVRIPVLPDHPQQRSKTVLNDRSSTKKNRCRVWKLIYISINFGASDWNLIPRSFPTSLCLAFIKVLIYLDVVLWTENPEETKILISGQW